jgi:2-amino-4-hydroxy-6-hydroxymethyldihydropteridine diphosphokinase
MINGIFLLLGSNKGDRKSNFSQSRKLLTKSGIAIKEQSSLYLSPPWGYIYQPYFLNQVIKVATSLPPQSLLDTCLEIENKMGRLRKQRYGQRVIDIDLLYYNQEIIENPSLIVPHPRLHLRRFTLVPMTELSPDFIHPLLKDTQKKLLEKCTDTLPVRRVFL